MEQEANKETESKIEEISKIGKEKGNKVVQDLLRAVLDVHPEPPSKS
jgi:V-type H+-transporting ATPase subunit G